MCCETKNPKNLDELFYKNKKRIMKGKKSIVLNVWPRGY